MQNHVLQVNCQLANAEKIPRKDTGLPMKVIEILYSQTRGDENSQPLLYATVYQKVSI